MESNINNQCYDNSSESLTYKDMWNELRNEIIKLKKYYDKGNDQLTPLECVDNSFMCYKILKLMLDIEEKILNQ